MAKRRVIWITWERQIRNRSMSEALRVPLFEIISSRSRIGRYASCISRTLEVLYRERPSIVICQNPSLVLTFFLLKLKPIFGFKVVIDAHFGGVEAYNGSEVFQRILDHCNGTADLVIVTNENHGRYVRAARGKTFVCPDPLPDLSPYQGSREEIRGKVFFICSFDIDEPFHEVFRAAEMLSPEGLRFVVSGNYGKAGIDRAAFPHMELLGFVPEVEFYHHLFSCQVVVDLTDHENCLVCGAYEALAAEKPLVLSKKRALQDYFRGGTVFTENRAGDIASAVRRAFLDRVKLGEGAREWASHTRSEMRQRLASLRILLSEL
jgi:glycosyltransferase involved in cell wall biosynthesis